MRCYSCMQLFEDRSGTCPHCGHSMTSGPLEDMHLTPGTCLDQGRYYIGLAVGQGGFGITYRAWDNTLDTKVAIKEFFPSDMVNRVPGQSEINIVIQNKAAYKNALRQFVEEIRAVGKFKDCENIVSVYAHLEENGTAYMIMEYIEGESLYDWIKRQPNREVSLEYAIKVAKDVGNALLVMHDNGMCHLDISPDNIMLLEDGKKIKLIDFGSARIMGRNDIVKQLQIKEVYAPAEVAQMSSVVSLHSMNEEQIRNLRDMIGPWSDVYELSAVLHEMLTGYPPSSGADRMVQDDYESPKDYCIWLKEMPDCVDVALRHGLAVNRKDRIQSIQEWLDILTDQKSADAWKKRILKQQKTLRLAMIVFLIAGMCLMVLQMFGQTNANSLKANLHMWICAGEGESLDNLKEYYEDRIHNMLNEDYSNIQVEVTAYNASEYMEKLSVALEDGTAPEIYESTNVDESIYSHSMSLDNVVSEIVNESHGEKQDHFIENMSNDKELPIGYTIPVVYTLRRDCPDMVKLEELEGKVLSCGEDMAVEKLLQGECEYLLGDTTDYSELQKAVYGSYEEQKNDVAGKLHVAYVEGGEVEYTTTFSINKDCEKREEQAAGLLIQYMLSYRGQMELFGQGDVEGVRDAQALPVHVKADEWYRESYRSGLAGLKDAVKNLD